VYWQSGARQRLPQEHERHVEGPITDNQQIEIYAKNNGRFQGRSVEADITMVYPLRGIWESLPGSAEHYGAAVAKGNKKRRDTYPELVALRRLRRLSTRLPCVGHRPNSHEHASAQNAYGSIDGGAFCRSMHRTFARIAWYSLQFGSRRKRQGLGTLMLCGLRGILPSRSSAGADD